MFKYPNGRTVMNSVICVLGAAVFLFGLLIFVTSFVPALQSFTQSGIDAVTPYIRLGFVNGLRTVGITLMISSFPSLMFAEISMKTNQTNKMIRKIYDRLRS